MPFERNLIVQSSAESQIRSPFTMFLKGFYWVTHVKYAQKKPCEGLGGVGGGASRAEYTAWRSTKNISVLYDCNILSLSHGL